MDKIVSSDFPDIHLKKKEKKKSGTRPLWQGSKRERETQFVLLSFFFLQASASIVGSIGGQRQQRGKRLSTCTWKRHWMSLQCAKYCLNSPEVKAYLKCDLKTLLFSRLPACIASRLFAYLYIPQCFAVSCSRNFYVTFSGFSS